MLWQRQLDTNSAIIDNAVPNLDIHRNVEGKETPIAIKHVPQSFNSINFRIIDTIRKI